MTLVDSNVLIDVLARDHAWLDWSIEALDRCGAMGSLAINEIVYAELAVRSASDQALAGDLETLGVTLERTPVAALYLAGKVFAKYRASGGARTSLIPDFFIGAHAQIADLPILTRDARRYRTYFPDVELIAPQD